MRINSICFTEKGACLSECLAEKLSKCSGEAAIELTLFAKYEAFSLEMHPNIEAVAVAEPLKDWTYGKQERKEALLFIGATGIAVRAIADGIKDKLQDAPVLVMDELGRFVIPLLAGHMGGANELALAIADLIGAVPVVTTATDLEGCFSVDLFAKENNLKIENREGIAKVSAKALEHKAIRLSIENYPPKDADVVISSDLSMRKLGQIGLCPKNYGLGIGCRKGIDFLSLEKFIGEKLEELGLSFSDLGAIASINLKEEETAILELSDKYHLPYVTYTPELLMQAKGTFEESAFVAQKTGVGNVCERAAMLLIGNQGELILKKTARDGMTLALAKQNDNL